MFPAASIAPMFPMLRLSRRARTASLEAVYSPSKLNANCRSFQISEKLSPQDLTFGDAQTCPAADIEASDMVPASIRAVSVKSSPALD